MMCRVFCIVYLCFFLLTGCGVPDNALVLTSENVQETAAEAEKSNELSSSDVREETEREKENTILVYVCGAVVNPGVVELSADCRAVDALEAAGGLLEEAQPDYVNLAAKLEDAQRLYFPTKEEAKELVQEASAAAEGLVNINTAGVEQLCTLPGIGESRAKDIISYRQQNGAFSSEEDIMRVSGIKQSAYEKLKGKITVR